MKKSNLYILTRCSRLDHILDIKDSIFNCYNDFWNVYWYIAFDNKKIKYIPDNIFNNLQSDNIKFFFDLNNSGILSYNMTNELLSKIEHRDDNWIYFLDDDNKLHENLLKESAKVIQKNNCKGIIFSQMIYSKDNRKSLFRIANKENIKVGYIDLAQYLINSTIIENHKFDISRYDADGVFIENIYDEKKDDFCIIDKILCYYNFYEE